MGCCMSSDASPPIKVSFSFYPADMSALNHQTVELRRLGAAVRRGTVLRALIEGRVDPDAAVLVAPMVGIRSPIGNRLGALLARVLARLDPTRAAWKVRGDAASAGQRERLLTHSHARYADEAYWYARDPALRLEPERLGWNWLDLGAEWKELTGLPMVFAAWAGKGTVLDEPGLREAFVASWHWGRDHMDEIVAQAEAERGFDGPLAHLYLTKYIQFELTPRHLKGLALFRSLVRDLDAIKWGVVR